MSNMLPSPDVLNEFENGKFALTNLAAKRAKQIKDGAPPLISIESSHPLTIALAEVAAGKIKPVLQSQLEAVEVEEMPYDKVTEEPLPPELGMLLPSLDEVDVSLVDAELHGEEEPEHEPEAIVGAEPLTLSDLVAGDEEVEETEPPPALGEEDTLSLSDIAEQETTLDEEEVEE